MPACRPYSSSRRMGCTSASRAPWGFVFSATHVASPAPLAQASWLLFKLTLGLALASVPL